MSRMDIALSGVMLGLMHAAAPLKFRWVGVYTQQTTKVTECTEKKKNPLFKMNIN